MAYHPDTEIWDSLFKGTAQSKLKMMCLIAYQVSDGVNGIRGESIHSSTKAACFPCAVSMAATFDLDLVKRVGQCLGEEARSKNVQVVLAPTVNLHRSPLGGRTFEAFSEDPVLSGLMGTAWVNGLQEMGDIVAVPKHLVCNEAETDREISNSLVDPVTLRELYLKPFQMILRRAKVHALMTSYNKLNGTSSSENPELLQNIVRKEWGYDGLLMSDWYGTYSTVAAAKVGVDLEMPGPAIHRGEKLLVVIKEGTVTEEDINERARRVLRLALNILPSLGGFEKTRHDPKTSELTRSVGADGIVLLKNDDAVLPLRTGQRIAVIGEPASRPIIKGGGSSTVAEVELVTPLEALLADFPDLISHQGVNICKKLRSPPRELLGEGPVTLQWYNGRDESNRQLVKVEVLDTLTVHVFDKPLVELEADHSVRLRCQLTPLTTGNHLFGVTSSGPSKVFINDLMVLEFPSFSDINPHYILSPGDYERRASISMEAGQTYEVRVEAKSTIATPPPGFRICPQAVQVGFREETSVDFHEALSDVDVALVFVGNSSDYESESFDRTGLSLSPGQDELVSRVSSIVGPSKTVVVNMSGSAVAMPWIDEVAGCVQAWFAGQQAGNSIADVLLGRTNPSGRLPLSFPRHIEDTASFGNFPKSVGLGHDVAYAEGIFIGYRHHLQEEQKEAMFPFGHGRSYSSFQYSKLVVEGNCHRCTVRVTVANEGPYRGKEAVLLFVRDVEASRKRAYREFQNCAKVFLEVGESAEVTLELDVTAFSFWSEERGKWLVEPGEFLIEIARSATEVVLHSSLTVDEEYEWSGLGP